MSTIHDTTPHRPPPRSTASLNPVDEAGNESFPASDPPSSTPIAALGPPCPSGNSVAADLMTPNLRSIRDDATVEEAIVFLADDGVSAAAVIDEAGRPVGVVSRADIVLYAREKIALTPAGPYYFETADLADGELPDESNPVRVRDVMTPALLAVGPDAAPEQVAEQMVQFNIHRLFVVDESGMLVGGITALDLLRHLRQQG